MSDGCWLLVAGPCGSIVMILCDGRLHYMQISMFLISFVSYSITH